MLGQTRTSATRGRISLTLSLTWLIAVGAVYAVCPAGSAQTKLGPSGLPLPRFVTVAASEANLRMGPGSRYPIEWVYRRSGLPVQIVAEYDLWRRVRDQDGDEGWMFGGLLSGRRNIVVMHPRTTLFAQAKETSARILVAEKGVQGRLLSCIDDWCRIKIDSSKGWVIRDAVWGVGPDEEFP